MRPYPLSLEPLEVRVLLSGPEPPPHESPEMAPPEMEETPPAVMAAPEVGPVPTDDLPDELRELVSQVRERRAHAFQDEQRQRTREQFARFLDLGKPSDHPREANAHGAAFADKEPERRGKHGVTSHHQHHHESEMFLICYVEPWREDPPRKPGKGARP